MPDLLSGHDAPITLRDMVEECRREVQKRRSVYPRWVAEGKIRAGEADRRIAVMEAVANRIEALFNQRGA